MPKPKRSPKADPPKPARRSSRRTPSTPDVAPARAKARPKAAVKSSGWGGRRPGAGRPPGPEPRQALHRGRGEHRAEQPVYINLRTTSRSLRTQAVFPTLRDAIREANDSDPEQFRVVHFSVQADQIHLIVEADDRRALVEGVRGLSIRIARRVNQQLGLEGRFFSDRWRGTPLQTPLDVRNALLDLFTAYKKHERGRPPVLDLYSSAPYFKDFAEYASRSPIEQNPRLLPRALASDEPPVLPATTKLLSDTWKQHGKVSVSERPRG